MNLNKSTLCLLALPVALLTGCPGDDGDTDTGANDTTGNTTGGPTTDDPDTDSPTTDDPDTGGTTDDPDTGGTTDDPDTGSTTDEPPPAEARVRVMHLGVGAPGVDVFANGEGPVFENLEFRNSTEYAAVPAGDYTFDVSVTGTPVEDAVLSPMLTLDADTAYTAVAIGDLNETDGAPPLQAIALVDDSADIDAANVRIQVIHAAPAVGQVDIWEVSGEPVELLSDVDFGVAATLPDIPAGPIVVGIDVDNDAVPDLTFDVDTTPLAGAQVNVYANNDDAGGVALVAQLGDGTVLTIPPL